MPTPRAPLPGPPDARRPLRITFRGRSLLGRPLYNKDAAYTDEERDWFGLHGLLPSRVLDLEEQLALELEHVRRKADDLEKFIGLAALQDRNETLFYRLLAENLEEFLPIVYTPTVGRACQEYSHIFRRPRGVWITPGRPRPDPGGAAQRRPAGRPPDRGHRQRADPRPGRPGRRRHGHPGRQAGPLHGRQRASIRPWRCPISLDVGTDNPSLLDDPLYLGWRHPRLRGAEYDAFVEAFVQGVLTVLPPRRAAVGGLQAAQRLPRARSLPDALPCFNDDIQGTAAVGRGRHPRRAPGGRMAASATSGSCSSAPARPAIGIARLLRSALREEGATQTGDPARDRPPRLAGPRLPRPAGPGG